MSIQQSLVEGILLLVLSLVEGRLHLVRGCSQGTGFQPFCVPTESSGEI
jgi:hypothetical protein